MRVGGRRPSELLELQSFGILTVALHRGRLVAVAVTHPEDELPLVVPANAPRDPKALAPLAKQRLLSLLRDVVGVISSGSERVV